MNNIKVFHDFGKYPATQFEDDYLKIHKVTEGAKEYFHPEEGKQNCRRVNRDEIIKWSKNKDDLETFLSVKKYNL